MTIRRNSLYRFLLPFLVGNTIYFQISETAGDVKKAIHFFTRASAYNNVIRICREHGFEDQLLNVALLSTPRDMLEAAIYFEEREDTVDKAVLLYHRAGNLPKAIELVFKVCFEIFDFLEN